jgi:biopolymer transport protein ExbD
LVGAQRKAVVYGNKNLLNLILKINMAQLQLQPATKGKKNRVLKAVLKIDMTPMVDLGFLLITFFVFTSSISNPAASTMVIPADGPPSSIPQSTSLSVILSKDNDVYVYKGIWDEALKTKSIIKTSYSMQNGLGDIIRKRQKELQQLYPNGRDTLMLLIKPTDASTYQNLVNALDEVMINKINRYVIMPPHQQEIDYVLQSN